VRRRYQLLHPRSRRQLDARAIHIEERLHGFLLVLTGPGVREPQNRRFEIIIQ
jgi:hypothetical protein